MRSSNGLPDNTETVFFNIAAGAIVNELLCFNSSLSEGDAKVHIFFYLPNFFMIFLQKILATLKEPPYINICVNNCGLQLDRQL